ncbi:hypothetical protein HELRODRAFT_95171 [Helobdella robusta]|uniref:Conserved oligomeric Golgi complex subunit 2 n=1 Tax=Helobdella robusta TaxID=6412 RepID=T1G948_HELRO|nr:hypothetical protein HELRODRAFT_95171 [Helobdella robusta]ESN96005.1 hypothetical protein HELRODRAFT_95171 [Helobdella robusta]
MNKLETTKEIIQSLPTAPPSLCFNKEEFMKITFNVEHFVVDCRRHTTLDILRNDLHMYLKILESAMVELINKDYADFLNLSTNLVGMDKMINSLIQPMNKMKSDITGIKVVVSHKINEINEKMKMKTKIVEKKENLIKMMNMIQSLEKLGMLLGLSSSKSEGNMRSTINKIISNKHNTKHNQLMARVAIDFNQLKFFVESNKQLPLTKEIEPYIKAISDVLLISLEAPLKECFLHINRNKNSDFISNNNNGDDDDNDDDLVSCLRTYASIDKMNLAEDLFRSVVVKEYMQTVINEEIIKEKGLKSMYDKVLEFVPKYCSPLTSITSNSLEAILGYDFIVNAVWPEIVHHLEFNTPSIFAPGNPDTFHKAYTTSVEFMDRFELQLSSQASVKRLRAHPSYISFISKWPTSVYFQIRFQEIGGLLELSLVNPFNLVKDMKEGGDTHLDRKFSLAATLNLCRCVSRCWHPSVHVHSLGHRFWKLSMQCVARYERFISQLTTHIKDINSSLKSSSITRVESLSSVMSSGIRRSLDPCEQFNSSSSLPPTMSTSCLPSLTKQQYVQLGEDGVSANNSNQDNSNNNCVSNDVQVNVHAATILAGDIRKAIMTLTDIFTDEMKPMLLKVTGINMCLTEEAWCYGLRSLSQHIPISIQFISNEISLSCMSELKSVNDIPRLYKRTNRNVPSKASAYVGNIMVPLLQFMKDHDGLVHEEDKQSIFNDVISNVTEAYIKVTTEVLASMKKMEESLKRLKAARGTSVETSNPGMTDDDKIRLQLSLDVQFYSQQVRVLKPSDEKKALDKLIQIVSNAQSTRRETCLVGYKPAPSSLKLICKTH